MATTVEELRQGLLAQIARFDALVDVSLRGRNDVASLVPAMMKAKMHAIDSLASLGDMEDKP